MDLSGRRHSAAAVVVMVVALALTGCSSDDPEAASSVGPDASTTTAAGRSPTTASPPPEDAPSNTAPAETGREGGACPGEETLPPHGATDSSEVNADVDGDGRDDRVLSYRRADGTGRVAVELAAGGTAAVDAGGPAAGPSTLSVLGGADLGGDGETVFAVTGSGASVVVIGLFQFVECAITPVVDSSGRTVELPVGGTVTHGDGLSCTGGAEKNLIALRATSSDGERFTTVDTRYRVDGNTLVEVDADRGTLELAGADAELQRYYTIDCPGLEGGPSD